MITQEVKGKLTAILSADVKGYSRLMGEDEKGTLHTLNAYSREASSVRATRCASSLSSSALSKGIYRRRAKDEMPKMFD